MCTLKLRGEAAPPEAPTLPSAQGEEGYVDPQPDWLVAYCNERIAPDVGRADLDSALEFVERRAA